MYFHHTVEMKRPHTITDPIEIQRIRIGFFLMNRLKLWGFTSMLWGFINLWWIPFKRYGGTHRFFIGKTGEARRPSL